MGWFLFNQSKKKRKTKRKPAATTPPRTVGRVLRKATHIALVAAVIVGIAAGWWWSQRELRERIGASVTTEPTIRLLDPPDWMPEPVVQELRLIVESSVVGNPFDQASLNAAAKRLGSSPWVRRVERVTRHPGNVVEVRLEYRRRAALLGTDMGYHLIDADAVRLPFVYPSEQARATGLPIIEGVLCDPPPVGRAWPGDDVIAGLTLAQCIEPQPWFGRLGLIDVSNFDGRIDPGRGHLRLAPARDEDNDPFNNPGVEWGRAPGHEGVYEPLAAWKLHRVAEDIRDNGRYVRRVLRVTSEPGFVLTASSGADSMFVHAADANAQR